MNSDDLSFASQSAATRSSSNVILSPYVNEPFPAWEELLSAHDVARLTRRPRWMLAGLVLLRRFPRKSRYHGRGIGWLRSDVLCWLTRELEANGCRAEAESIARRRVPRQGSLPLECVYPCEARRYRVPCTTRESRR